MKRLIFAIAFLLSSCGGGGGESSEAPQAPVQGGASYLGLCSATTDCDALMQTWDGQKTIVIGWLENTFGESCPCADRILQDPRYKIVRVHLVNGTCFPERGRTCGSYEVFAGETAKSASRKIEQHNFELLERFRLLAKSTHERLKDAAMPTTCYVSPCLECDLTYEARKILLDLASSYFPYCTIVDNPLHGPIVAGYVGEYHGNAPSVVEPCIADLDGVDGREADVERFNVVTNACSVQYYWEKGFNCLQPGGFVDPRSRNCKQSPDYYKRIGRIVSGELSEK